MGLETPPPSLEGDGLPPLWDTGNTLLATGLPSMLLVGKVPLPGGGEAGIATIRTQCTTLFLTLTKEAAQEWADTFTELAGTLSGSALLIPTRDEAQAVRGAMNGKRPGG